MKTLLLLFALRPPLGLDMYMPVPEANPLTPAKVALGRRLFFDKRLSRDGTLASASCKTITARVVTRILAR
jgi:cytochrome c peroxidase